MGDLYHAALWHDAEECFTGDIPGPAKRNIKGDMADIWTRVGVESRFPHQVRPITKEIKMIVKAANLLDEAFYKATEIQMGNRNAQQTYQLSCDRLLLAIRLLPITATGVAELWKKIENALNLHLAGTDRLPKDNDYDLAPKH
jgi:5'-deoxynucleotidase YfbR-like HD superfamily hydrolase